MEHIDLYCERTGPDVWSEPLNAVTNLAFLLAAWLCWRRYARVSGALDVTGTVLMLLVGAIGVGSGLFHTFATRWAMLADVIPIAIFIHAFLFFALRRFFALSYAWAVLLTLAFAVVANGIPFFSGGGELNGSEGYLPPMAALFVMGLAMHVRGHGQGRALMAAAGVFLVSLAARTVDMAVCQSVPFGTHFLWHVFNGVALYIAGRAYMLSSSAART